MPYDTIPNYESVKMNLGKSFTVGGNYGGVAFLGNTREGYVGSSSRLEEYFIQQLIKGHYKVGQAEAFSKVDYNDGFQNHYNRGYLSYVHNLLGDPELEIWTDIPQQFSNIVVTRSNNSITVSGLDTNSTIVAIYNNDGEVRQITTNSMDTNITYNANPNSTIMLYKHNYIPYIAPLVLQKVSMNHSQYVIASDVVAGNSVDSNRTPGDVTIKNGVEYEIEASGTVTLQGGFSVEKGATFAVYPASF
jgi:hypothetical protein